MEFGVRPFFADYTAFSWAQLLKLWYGVSEALLCCSVRLICSSQASLWFRVSQASCYLNTPAGGRHGACRAQSVYRLTNHVSLSLVLSRSLLALVATVSFMSCSLHSTLFSLEQPSRNVQCGDIVPRTNRAECIQYACTIHIYKYKIYTVVSRKYAPPFATLALV